MDHSPSGSSVFVTPSKNTRMGGISYSRGSSWPKDQTCISCIGRRILYHWVNWRIKIPFFPGKDSANEKLWTSYLLQRSQLPFPSMKDFPCCVVSCMWLTRVADSRLQFSANLKPTGEEISGILFALGQCCLLLSLCLFTSLWEKVKSLKYETIYASPLRRLGLPYTHYYI